MSAHVFVMNSIILAIGKLDTDSISSISPNSNDARAVWTTEKYTRKEQSNLLYSLLENVIFKLFITDRSLCTVKTQIELFHLDTLDLLCILS